MTYDPTVNIADIDFSAMLDSYGLTSTDTDGHGLTSEGVMEEWYRAKVYLKTYKDEDVEDITQGDLENWTEYGHKGQLYAHMTGASQLVDFGEQARERLADLEPGTEEFSAAKWGAANVQDQSMLVYYMLPEIGERGFDWFGDYNEVFAVPSGTKMDGDMRYERIEQDDSFDYYYRKPEGGGLINWFEDVTGLDMSWADPGEWGWAILDLYTGGLGSKAVGGSEARASAGEAWSDVGLDPEDTQMWLDVAHQATISVAVSLAGGPGAAAAVSAGYAGAKGAIFDLGWRDTLKEMGISAASAAIGSKVGSTKFAAKTVGLGKWNPTISARWVGHSAQASVGFATTLARTGDIEDAFVGAGWGLATAGAMDYLNIGIDPTDDIRKIANLTTRRTAVRYGINWARGYLESQDVGTANKLAQRNAFSSLASDIGRTITS